MVQKDTQVGIFTGLYYGGSRVNELKKGSGCSGTLFINP